MKTRRNVVLAILGACTALLGADDAAPARWSFVTPRQAEAETAALGQQYSSAAMWIWADRYSYRPGESLTLRWTIKPHNDPFPYTIFAFRMNNQTGVKTFLPGESTTPIDIFGRGAEEGYQITRLPSATKQVLVGADGVLAGPLAIPNELGMHTITVQLRDFTGTRVLKSAYWKISVVDEVIEITGNIEASRTLLNTKAYYIRGVVTVRNNAVLTIQPGTILFGQTGSQPPSVLLISRTGRINANGTKSRPIIMTSRTIDAPVGSRRRGDWGGILMLGAAQGNVPAAQSFVEGLTQSPDTQWGGTDDAHNCGTLRYVRSEYAGVQLAPNNETNGIVWAGCGSGTVAEYLQAHYGNDDAFEWFGGTASAKHLVATYAEDDNLDYQLGWRGNLQYAVILQNPTDRGNRGVEGDNSEFDNTATPFSKPTMFNVTMIGSGVAGSSEADGRGFYLRRGARGVANNFIVMNWGGPGIFFDGTATQAQVDNGEIAMDGVLLWNNNRAATPPGANNIAGQVAATEVTFAQGSRGQGRQIVVADPMMRRPLEYSDPDFLPLASSPIFLPGWIQPPDNGFFDQSANFAGAFGEVNWTEEWTNFHQEHDVAQ